MFVRVAVPVPQLDLLTYRVPEGSDVPAVGARAIVPLGSRLVTGIVVGSMSRSDEDLDPAAIKPISRVLDREPFIPADVVHLALWTAEYYAAGIGEVLTAVLPPKTRGARADAHKTQRIVELTVSGREATTGHGKLHPRAMEALRQLVDARNGRATSELATVGVTSALLSRLESRGLVSFRAERVERDPFEPLKNDPQGVSDTERVLTEEQRRALIDLGAILTAGVFRVALLHGVTGSGKTEIYRQLAIQAHAAGRRTLILVPEIALTPAVASTFRETFGHRVAIQHSGLSDGERHDQWQRIRRDEIDVVVGTRSAVFAPLSCLGLVIVDEEHDGSYKQEESPRYNARDVAIVRAQQAKAVAVLGSATPSIETYYNAVSGKYTHVALEQRVLARPLASVTVVDMREEFAAEGPDVVLSRRLKSALAERLANREQSLVLLNRRGLATTVFCRQCAATIDCPNCSVSLVVHGVHGERGGRRARCHYCNFSRPVPATCPSCAAPYLEQMGFGTERVEREIADLFPELRVARLDRDAIRRKGALTSLLARFRRGDIDVLVGTQMVAKGHDFPRVTLVGVVSADVGLGMADFRAAERTFQLLTQVAGRAGRGEQPGEAIIQTLYPAHYSIELACRQDYPAFYAREVEFRHAMRYPPRVALINVIVRARTMAGAMKDAGGIVADVESHDGREALRILGPAPAPLARLRGEYRAQILIKGSNRRSMREAVIRAIAKSPQVARRTTIDIDPVSVL